MLANILAAPETRKAAQKYKWRFDDAQPEVDSKGRILQDVPVAAIRRPLGRTRGNGESPPQAWSNPDMDQVLQKPEPPLRPIFPLMHADQEKVEALMASIQEIGLQEPVGGPVSLGPAIVVCAQSSD